MVSTEAIVTRKYRSILFLLSTIFLFSQTGISTVNNGTVT